MTTWGLRGRNRSRARESRRHNDSSTPSSYLGALIDEFDEDRETLATVMNRLAIERSQVKEAGGWVAEKLSRIKFQLSLGADDPVPPPAECRKP
jgi:hypothetical protein